MFIGYHCTWDERQAATAALAVASRVLPSLKLSSAACTAASTCSVASLAACASHRLQTTDFEQAPSQSSYYRLYTGANPRHHATGS